MKEKEPQKSAWTFASDPWPNPKLCIYRVRLYEAWWKIALGGKG